LDILVCVDNTRTPFINMDDLMNKKLVGKIMLVVFVLGIFFASAENMGYAEAALMWLVSLGLAAFYFVAIILALGEE
tara:strand:- start:47 stop:277 length:231 start_codon:yes stop_codon:yes gene_type:complete